MVTAEATLGHRAGLHSAGGQQGGTLRDSFGLVGHLTTPSVPDACVGWWRPSGQCTFQELLEPFLGVKAVPWSQDGKHVGQALAPGQHRPSVSERPENVANTPVCWAWTPGAGGPTLALPVLCDRTESVTQDHCH
jgi:hypothetical protein